MSATIQGAAGAGAEASYWDGTQWVSVGTPNQANIDAGIAQGGGPNSILFYGDNISGDGAITLGGAADFASGRGGAESLYGGDGNDILIGGGGADRLEGGAGADTLIGGNATVTGSLDNPSISASDDGLSTDVLVGGQGDDTYIVTNTSDQIIGAVGDGTDSVLLAGPTNYTLGEGTSVEAIGLLNPASTTPVRITGNSDGQSISGGAGADTLDGGGGNDTLFGSGNDSLSGGTGNDLFSLTGSGNTAAGGDGDDTITFGDAGDYTVTGASGNFTIAGGSGSNVVSGMDYIQTNSGTFELTSGTFYVCFAPGTRILTAEGEVEVEKLRAGDLVATVSGRGVPMKPVLWVGRRRVVLAGHPSAEELAPVRIRAGALGNGAPHRDLLVSPDHCLHLDGRLVPARLLVNGGSVAIERGVSEITWYHVELEGHDVLLAEGAAAESWLDCGNRSWFENAPVARLAVAGGLAEAGAGWDADRACAPLVHGGPELAAIRAALATGPALPDRRAA